MRGALRRRALVLENLDLLLGQDPLDGRSRDNPLGEPSPRGVERAHIKTDALPPPIEDQTIGVDDAISARQCIVAPVGQQALDIGVLLPHIFAPLGLDRWKIPFFGHKPNGARSTPRDAYPR